MSHASVVHAGDAVVSYRLLGRSGKQEGDLRRRCDKSATANISSALLYCYPFLRACVLQAKEKWSRKETIRKNICLMTFHEMLSRLIQRIFRR